LDLIGVSAGGLGEEPFDTCDRSFPLSVPLKEPLIEDVEKLTVKHKVSWGLGDILYKADPDAIPIPVLATVATGARHFA